MAMIMTPVITTGMNAVPQDDAGHASWMLNLSQRGGGAFAISMLSSLLQRETTLQTFRLGGSPLINTPPSAEIVREGMRAGFSAAEAASVATAIFGRQIRRAAGALAFQKLYLLTGLVTITAVIPAFFFSTAAERADWRLIGRGEGIHWAAIDEDISVTHLLTGIASGESAQSLTDWSQGRRTETSTR